MTKHSVAVMRLKHLVDRMADLRDRSGRGIGFEFAGRRASDRGNDGDERGNEDDEAKHRNEAQSNAPEKDRQSFIGRRAV